MKPGTRVKIVNPKSPNFGVYGTVIPLEDLAPWATAHVRLDNGGSYSYSSAELETVDLDVNDLVLEVL